MPEKKKQHFIPKFYMKNFSVDGKNFYVYNTKKSKYIGFVPYKNQCQSDYFYGLDKKLENELSIKENEWRNAIINAITCNNISTHDIARIKEFIIYQRQRTEAAYLYNNDTFVSLAYEEVKMYCENKGIAYTEKILKEICRKYVLEHQELGNPISFVEKCMEEISDLNLLLIRFNTKTKLISSDAPVVALNPLLFHAFGYSNIGIAYLLPLNPQTLAVLYDAQIYKKYRNCLYIESFDENEVKELNNLQYVSSEKVIYSYDDIRDLTFNNSVISNRKRCREADPISTMGTKGNKIIATTTRRVYSDYDFSFLELSHAFKRIPEQCRQDNFTRKWSQGWEDKCKMNKNVFCAISKHNGEIFKDMGIQPKEYYKGLDRMSIELIKYWQNNGTYKN